METIQHVLTLLASTWYQVDANELMSFGIFFIAMWLIAMVLEATIQNVTKRANKWKC